MSRNQVKGAPEAGHYKMFDALPVEFKRALWLAPFDYKVRPFETLAPHRRGPPALKRWRGKIAIDTVFYCRETYGPEHPQAQA